MWRFCKCNARRSTAALRFIAARLMAAARAAQCWVGDDLACSLAAAMLSSQSVCEWGECMSATADLVPVLMFLRSSG